MSAVSSLPETQPAPFHVCSCRRTYSLAEFFALPIPKTMRVETNGLHVVDYCDGRPAEVHLYRDCPCGSTMTVLHGEVRLPGDRYEPSLDDVAGAFAREDDDSDRADFANEATEAPR